MPISHDVESNGYTVSYDFHPKVKIKGLIMYFRVNASHLKSLDVVTSNFVRS